MRVLLSRGLLLVLAVGSHQLLQARIWESCGWECQKVPMGYATREKIVARGYPYGNDYTGGPYIGTPDEPYARPYYYQSRWPFTFGYMAVETGKKVPSSSNNARRVRKRRDACRCVSCDCQPVCNCTECPAECGASTVDADN